MPGLSKKFGRPKGELCTASTISLGIGLLYISLLVLLPMAVLSAKVLSSPLSEIVESLMSPRVYSAFRLSFGLSLAAALVNTFLGMLVAWVLARYSFPGKRALDALVDLPFALPTAVAGIALCGLYGPEGFLGSMFEQYGVQIAYTPYGIFVAMLFVGFPFVVRTVQPVIANLDFSQEETAACLGASRLYTYRRVILPMLMPALLTGFSMAFARSVGEYGSVVFIAGNIPEVSEIVPLLIVARLESYDFTGAAALSLLMLATSFVMLMVINIFQRRINR
ncbi:MAG: sulfate ABC transporter permease subunit CysT [Victivallales bacterium]|nr:sulfate ABC transporter permease subunit CysT [Victivallales bacterium]